MLDIIRKKASDWGVKVIFGIIIIVFVFFFGYNRISQRYKGARGGTVVAVVDGTNITRPEFQLAYDNTYKMYQNIFKGKEGEALPEGVQKSVKNTALNQLIQQEVIKSLGEKLDIQPTNLELAESVRNSPTAKNEEGQFDPYLYRHRFLPYFAQKFNMDYEDLVRSGLLTQKVQDIFALGSKAPLAKGFYDMEKTKWTFKVTEYDNEDLAKANKGGKPKKVGPINISERGQIFPADIDIETWEKVFTLKTKSKSAAPINVSGKWYVVKTVKIDLPQNSQWEKDKETYFKTISSRNEQELFQTWISSLLKTAKIKKYIEE